MKIFSRVLLSAIILVIACSCREGVVKPEVDHAALSAKYFAEDAQWYLANIPFFECSDKQIEEVYYYRWKLYKAHLRNIGPDQFVITEFINDVHWDRDPYSTINAASGHHIYEGRWLRDDRYMDGYIHYLYQMGGNNRSYSEWIADASYARYLVNGDSDFITAQLDSMKHIYNEWTDHWEQAKDLYYIPAMPDATEYTIASIDASGGKDGFEGGEAFRPTFNSYMYGNAIAISKIASLKGDSSTAKDFLGKATELRSVLVNNLWNDSLKHFTDRFKVSNKFVHYWDFIRGRELAGMIPWYFNLPPDDAVHNAAWKHVTDTTQLLGKYGLRTNEPSYEYYFKQFVFTFGRPGSQWNGPSWPFQSSLAIRGMANFINNYQQEVVTASDYLKVFRQFTQQHYLPDGRVNLVENYDPNRGGPIVYFYWSNHYNHSSYNDLVITGLCGIRPSDSDTLTINPIVDSSIKYFYLDNVMYHGHKLTLAYDEDGHKYGTGKGLTVFIDGGKTELNQEGKKYKAYVGTRKESATKPGQVNVALNISKKNYPVASASVNSVADSIYQAIDGKIWYFPEISNRWTTEGSPSKEDWYQLDFGEPKDISSLRLSFYADGKRFTIPDNISIEYEDDGKWLTATISDRPMTLTANTTNKIGLEKFTSSKIRLHLGHATKDIALTELECY